MLKTSSLENWTFATRRTNNMRCDPVGGICLSSPHWCATATRTFKASCGLITPLAELPIGRIAKSVVLPPVMDMSEPAGKRGVLVQACEGTTYKSRCDIRIGSVSQHLHCHDCAGQSEGCYERTRLLLGSADLFIICLNLL